MMWRSLVVAGLAAPLVSCSDAVGPASGSVSGVVSLSTVWGRVQPSGGVVVAIDGTDRRATSLADGQWNLPSVPRGALDVSFTKAGYGPMKAPGVVVSGSVVLRDTTYMAETPAHSAIIDSTVVSTQYGDSALLIYGHVTATPPVDAVASAVVTYEGTSAAVSPDLATHVFSQATISVAQRSDTGGVTPPSADFLNLFFLKELRQRHGAAPVFFTAYASSATCSCYRDRTTQRLVFTNVGPRANTIAITLP